MPLSRNESLRIQTLIIIDALLVAGCLSLGDLSRNLIRESFEDYNTTWIWMIAVPFIPLSLEFFGFYRRISQRSAGASIAIILKALFVIGFIIGVMVIFAKISEARRLSLALSIVYIFFAVLIRDKISALHLISKRKTGNYNAENVIFAGRTQEIQNFLRDIEPESLAAWNIVSTFDLENYSAEELYALMKNQSIGRVIIAPNGIDFEKVGKAVEACELQGVEAWIGGDFISTQIARPVFDVIGNKPMLVLRSTPDLSWELMCKMILDRICAVIIILVTLPLWLLAAIGIRLQSPDGSIFYGQMRAGKYGKPFKIWKFRTMISNAENLLDQVKKQHGNEMDGPVFKLDDDPRIFPFGSWLRKMSIDELPQLINVLKGEMSLVGPRPLPLYEVDAFPEISHRRRLSVKPGITCEWQVSGRSRITSFNEWVEMDLRYIDNWSFWLDLQILLRTIPAVLLSKGAK